MTLFGLALGLAFAEGALRLVVPISKASLYVYDSTSLRCVRMKPCYQSTVYGVAVRTNALGFRDHQDQIPPKAPDEFRLIVLGDSYTAGSGVPYDSLFTSVLERSLAAGRPGRHVRVINLACPGYCIVQYGATLKEVGWSLHPDMVVVAIYVPNDWEITGYRNARRAAFAGVKEVPYPWYERTDLFRVYTLWFSGIPGKVGRLFGHGKKQDVLAGRRQAADEGVLENSAALDTMAESCREHHVPLLAMLLAGTFDYASQVAEQERARALCRADSIPYVTVLETLMASGSTPPSFRLNFLDAHPNTRDHRLVAALLHERLAHETGLRAQASKGTSPDSTRVPG